MDALGGMQIEALEGIGIAALFGGGCLFVVLFLLLNALFLQIGAKLVDILDRGFFKIFLVSLMSLVATSVASTVLLFIPIVGWVLGWVIGPLVTAAIMAPVCQTTFGKGLGAALIAWVVSVLVSIVLGGILIALLLGAGVIASL
jgi:hypothetical protein